MILGIDASGYFETLASGVSYFAHGQPVEPLKLLADQGVHYLRIRVWKNPYSLEGKPYHGGGCDYANYIKLSKLAMGLGYSIVLDPHMSDFWTDPAKQTMPKGWEKLNEAELLKAVNDYTYGLFSDSKRDGVSPAYIQLGNEITNGMLWPYAHLGEGSPRAHYDHLVKILKIMSANARKVFPKAQLIIHLERSQDNAVYREFFDQMVLAKVDYDIIGMSYYPYWHGGFDTLFANIDDMESRYGKAVMIMETSYAFTLDDYIKDPDGKSKLVLSPESVRALPYALPEPLTPEGQVAFLKKLLALAKQHHVLGLFYWEPFWIPGKKTTSWSSLEGVAYTGESHAGTRNEVANQCLFGYDGEALPGLYEWKLPKGGK